MEDEKKALAESKGHKCIEDNIVEQNETNNKVYRDLNFEQLKQIKPKAVTWLWNAFIPLGNLTILAGAPGVGKTTATCKLLACVTKGEPIFDMPVQQGRVIFYSSEDSYSESLLHRLASAGADISKIEVLNDESFNPAKDIDVFLNNIEDKYINKPDSNLKVIVLDPLHEFIGGDTNRASNVASALRKLSLFAEKYKLAFIGIHHFSKNTQESTLLDRVTGSVQYVAKARVVLAIDHDDKGNAFLGVVKSNYSRKNRTLRFEILPKTQKYKDFDGLFGTSEVVFTDYYEFLHIDDALKGKKMSKWEIKHSEYAEMLEDFIREKGGKCLTSELENKLVPSVFENANRLRKAKEKSEYIQNKKIGNDWYCILIEPNSEEMK